MRGRIAEHRQDGLHLYMRIVLEVGLLPTDEYCVRFENGAEVLDVLECYSTFGNDKKTFRRDSTRRRNGQSAVLVPPSDLSDAANRPMGGRVPGRWKGDDW